LNLHGEHSGDGLQRHSEKPGNGCADCVDMIFVATVGCEWARGLLIDGAENAVSASRFRLRKKITGMISKKTTRKARKLIEKALKRVHRSRGLPPPSEIELCKVTISTMPFGNPYPLPQPPKSLEPRRLYARGRPALLPKAGLTVGICDLCGEEKSLTKHHVVPRSEWPFRVGEFEELTVPACPECHQLVHEYFSNMCLAEMPWDAVRVAVRVILYLKKN
jgi:hypothetical protein